MKKIVCTMASLLILASCATKQEKDDFDYTVESFADLEILRYKVPGFEELIFKTKRIGLLPLRSCGIRPGYTL